MQFRRFLVALLLILIAFPSFAGKSVSVRGYTRKDGTYVAPHTRSAPGSGSSRTYTPKPSYTPLYTPSPTYTAPKPPKPPKPPTYPSYTPSFGSTSSHSSHSKPHVYKAPKTYTPTYGLPERDAKGRFKRSSAAKHQFMVRTGYPHGRPGYIVDHIIPLCKGGRDDPSNLQWQTVAQAKAKDKWECR